MDSGEFRGFAGRAGSLAAGRAAVCNFSHIHKTSDRTDLPACHNGALRLAQMEVSRRAGAPPAAAADRSHRSHRFPTQPHPLYGCGKMARRPAAGVGGRSAKPKLGENSAALLSARPAVGGSRTAPQWSHAHGPAWSSATGLRALFGR
jgi:hypothetical protein